jgi:hypothetical protein
MKRILCLIALLAGVSSAAFCRNVPQVAAERDSLIIIFGKRTQIVIYSEDKEELRRLRNYDVNALLDQVIPLLDASMAAPADTSVVVDGDTVVVRGNRVVIRGQETDEEVSITIRVERSDDSRDRNDQTIVRTRRERSFRRTESEFVIDLGFNNLILDGQFPTDTPYELRTWGSRNIALGYIFKSRVGGRRSPLDLTYGLEFSAHNFMFDSNDRIRRGDEQIFFQPTGESLRKNKLTVLYLSLPVMPLLDFRHPGWGGLRLGLGGYAGYRLSTYSKIVYFEDGNRVRNRERNNFFVNDFRYGLVGQIGYRGISLFVKYDLNPLFRDNRGLDGADINAISFGIRL